jgi:hypothetical protein
MKFVPDTPCNAIPSYPGTPRATTRAKIIIYTFSMNYDGPSDVPFGEHERRKLDLLAEPFIGPSVSNLPAVLEGTINSYHNENASRLIEHAHELSQAQNDLKLIIRYCKEMQMREHLVKQRASELARSHQVHAKSRKFPAPWQQRRQLNVLRP